MTIANDSTGVVSVDDNGGSLTVDGAVSISGTVTVDTELPAAAALSDTASNPTTVTVGSALLGWDGTQWVRIHTGIDDGHLDNSGFLNTLGMMWTGAGHDRMRGDATNGLDVDVTRVQGSVTVAQSTAANLKAEVSNTGTFAVQATQSGAWTADTELPAAAALADATANPTTPLAGAANEVFNGTTWDRLRSAKADGSTNTGLLNVSPMVYNGSTYDLVRGDTANGLDVDVTRVSGTVTVDTELPSAAALADATANPTVPLAGSPILLYNGTTWDRVRGDITNGVDVDVTRVSGTVTTSEAAPTTVLNGNTNVTTAGTRVTLAGSTTCKSVTIKAKVTNTGTIYVGSSTVSSSNGFQLLAGESISLDIANLNTVNIDSSVSGEGVTYVGVN